MKTVAYIRVSSEEQAVSGLGLHHQKKKVEAYAEAMDLDLVEVIEDAGKSAKDLHREGIQSALAKLKAGEAQALLIYKLDRLTRSVKDLGSLVEFFEKKNITLISAQDSINTGTAAGRMVLNILGSVAQWEREVIGERTKSAMSVLKDQGRYTGGHVPFGFRLENGFLVEDEKEQEALQLMKELRKRGMSYRAIVKELNDQGVNSKAGKKWHVPTVVKALKQAA